MAREFHGSGGRSNERESWIYVSDGQVDFLDGNPDFVIGRPESPKNPNGIWFSWLTPNTLQIEGLGPNSGIFRDDQSLDKEFDISVRGRKVHVKCIRIDFVENPKPLKLTTHPCFANKNILLSLAKGRAWEVIGLTN